MPKTPNNEHLLQQHCMLRERVSIGRVVLADTGCGPAEIKAQ